VPGFSARAVALRQRLAVLVRAFDAAEIGAFARPRAGDEERHLGRLWQLRRCRRLLLGLRRDDQKRCRCRQNTRPCRPHCVSSAF
jgi:hypothetical protein